MKNILFAIAVFLVAISCDAQWRLDGDVRLGRSHIYHYIPWESHGPRFTYLDSFSFGADMNVGWEFNRGWGLYSGLMYDMMRFEGVDLVLGIDDSFRKVPSGMHVFSFITVPVRVEYRFLKDIIRPYAGFGAGFQVAEHKNRTEEYHGLNNYIFKHNIFVPTALFGLNLEYKHFIVGFAQKIDFKEFWSMEDLGNTWRMSQTTVKIGYRIF